MFSQELLLLANFLRQRQEKLGLRDVETQTGNSGSSSALPPL
jgi:hypothetical protein